MSIIQLETLRSIEKEYVLAQKGYKDAIRNYTKYHKMYSGCRLEEVAPEHRLGVNKIGEDLKTLQNKSREVKQILNWLNHLKKGADLYEQDKCNYTNKNVRRTILSIKREIGL